MAMFMKLLFITILFISFMGIAVFGFANTLQITSQNDNNNCALAAFQGIDHPRQSKPFDYLSCHLNTLKNFLTDTSRNFTTSLLILSLLFAGVSLKTLPGNLKTPEFNLAYHRLKRTASFGPPSKYEFIRWLAFHENSPANFIGRQ